jgi:hypothetical protein
MRRTSYRESDLSLAAIQWREQRSRAGFAKLVTKLAAKGAGGDQRAERLATGLLEVARGPSEPPRAPIRHHPSYRIMLEALEYAEEVLCAKQDGRSETLKLAWERVKNALKVTEEDV